MLERKILRNHLTATIETPEEKKMRLAEEREARAKRAKAIAQSKAKNKNKDETDELFHKYEPKEDYQVLQAVNYLKSFQVYKHFQSASR